MYIQKIKTYCKPAHVSSEWNMIVLNEMNVQYQQLQHHHQQIQSEEANVDYTVPYYCTCTKYSL